MLIDPEATLAGRTPGLPDDAFIHDGLITKRLVRATALAYLRPLPGETLWDIGAGAGSVTVEWCRQDPKNRALAVEKHIDRSKLCQQNLDNLTLPGQAQMFLGPAQEVVDAWIASEMHPDAVFIGGGASMELVETCWQVLPLSGRILLHAVTLETEQILWQAHQQLGGQLGKIALDQVESIGTMRGWKSARTIVTWFATKH